MSFQLIECYKSANTQREIFMAFNFHCNDLTIQMAKQRSHGNYSVTETMTDIWLNRIQRYYHCWGTSSGDMRRLLAFSSTIIHQRIPVFQPRTPERAQNISHACWHTFFIFFPAALHNEENAEELKQHCTAIES